MVRLLRCLGLLLLLAVVFGAGFVLGITTVTDTVFVRCPLPPSPPVHWHHGY